MMDAKPVMDWVCDCGCGLFIIRSIGVFCHACGKYQVITHDQ